MAGSCCEYRECVNDKTLGIRWLRGMLSYGSVTVQVCDKCKPEALHVFDRIHAHIFEHLCGEAFRELAGEVTPEPVGMFAAHGINR